MPVPAGAGGPGSSLQVLVDGGRRGGGLEGPKALRQGADLFIGGRQSLTAPEIDKELRR